MDTLQIIYASTSGNVEIVAEHAAKYLIEKNIRAELHRAEATSANVLTENTHFILATSTWEHGEVNPFFLPLLKEMNSLNLSNKKSGFIGLGDTRYEPVLFCEGIEIVKRAFLKSGGEEVYKALKINGEPYEILENVLKAWVNKFSEQLYAK